MCNSKTYIVVVALLGAMFFSFAENTGIDKKYQIQQVVYDIKGSTREYPLSMAVNIDKATVFQTRESLEAYIQDLTIQFNNLRVLESVDIETEFQNEIDDIIPVTLIIHTKDTWNFIFVPGYPKYDSNSGFQFKLKLKDFNFFGSMETMSSDFVYAMNRDGQSVFSTNIDFSIPFQVFSRDFEFAVNSSIEFPCGEVPEFAFETNLEYIIPSKLVDVHMGLKQKLVLNGRDDDDNIYVGDEHFVNETAYINMPFVLGHFNFFDELLWTPSFSCSTNCAYDGIQNDDLKGPDLSVGHALSFGRVDWHENFRKGFTVSLSNTYSYDLYFYKPGISIGTTLEAYEHIGHFVGIYSRLTGFYNFLNSQNDSIGSYLRGILNNDVSSDTAFVLNLDMPIRFVKIDFDKFTQIKWIQYLSFEMQASPFIDIALIHDETTNTYYAPSDGWYAGGLEILVFPQKMRSVYIRGSLGFNLENLIELHDFSSPELYIGVGLFY